MGLGDWFAEGAGEGEAEEEEIVEVEVVGAMLLLEEDGMGEVVGSEEEVVVTIEETSVGVGTAVLEDVELNFV